MWLMVDELRAVNLDSAVEVVIEEDYAIVQFAYDYLIFAEGSIEYEEVRRWLLLQQRLTKKGMSSWMKKVDEALFNDLIPAWIHLKDSGLKGAEQNRHALTGYLLGKQSSVTKENVPGWTEAECDVLLKWSQTIDESGSHVPHPDAMAEAAKVVKAFLEEKGQQQLV